MTPDQEASFSRSIAEQGDALFRYARVLTAAAHDAEDMLQTVLLGLARNWHKDLEAPVGYARTALRNLAADGGRRRHLVPVTSADEPVVPREPDLADAFATAATVDVVLSMLPPRQRVTVVLRVLDGLSEAETAAALQCSPGTVKSNLSRRSTPA